MPVPIRKVPLTGRHVQHPSGTLHEVICPECRFPQFHKQGINRCIICGERWQVTSLTFVRNEPVDLPEINQEENHESKENEENDDVQKRNQ